MPYYFLNQREHDLIKSLVDQARKGRVNVPSRPDGGRAWNENEDHQSPEVYVALPPADGIPALTRGAGTGTGVDGENDSLYSNVPGSATCEIYRILENEAGEAEIKPVEGLTRTVYNLTTSVISQDWITVHRTKFGPWVAGAGGGVQLSHGIITSVCDTSCNTYVVRRIRRTVTQDCGGTGTGSGS